VASKIIVCGFEALRGENRTQEIGMDHAAVRPEPVEGQAKKRGGVMLSNATA
jgi:hypothetical protein